MFARVLDKSLRYTVDKTTREILFLPLPRRASSTRRSRSSTSRSIGSAAPAAALLLLVLIKPWGLNLGWQQISYASLVVMACGS